MASGENQSPEELAFMMARWDEYMLVDEDGTLPIQVVADDGARNLVRTADEFLQDYRRQTPCTPSALVTAAYGLACCLEEKMAQKRKSHKITKDWLVANEGQQQADTLLRALGWQRLEKSIMERTLR